MITIIIPMYNAAKYIDLCLGSIIGQTYKDWQCIIVDDASIDNSFDIAMSYANNDSRFHVYANDKNLGCGLTRRSAIQYALSFNPDYCAFIDIDDYFEKDFLSIMLDACERTSSEISICGTKYRTEDYKYIKQDLCEVEYITSKYDLYDDYMTSSWILQYNGNKLYSARLMKQIQYCDMRFCEDSTTTYKWLVEANQAVVLPISMYNYVQHDDSNSKNNNSELQKAYDTCKCCYDHWQFVKHHNLTKYEDRLRCFAKQSIITCIVDFDINSKEYRLIDKIRNEMQITSTN